MKLEGKIAIISGGSAGIGLATGRCFIDEGAERVYLTGRREAELQAAALSLGPRAVPVQADASKAEDMERAYDLIRKEAGRLDIVFANAGFGEIAPLGTITEAHVDYILNTKIKGMVWTVQTALPLMSSGGSIILNSSITASKGFPGRSIYAAGNAAIRSFARTWASDLKGRGIRINVVSPGMVDTGSYKRLGLSIEERDALHGRIADMTPLGRLGFVEEIAKAVAFLASDESGFMTGSDVAVDGGLAQI